MIVDGFKKEISFYSYNSESMINEQLKFIRLKSLPEIFDIFANELKNTKLKEMLVNLYSKPEKENTKIIMEHLDDEFKAELFDNAQNSETAVKEIILSNTLFGYTVPQKYLDVVITEENALFCEDADAILKYYESYNSTEKRYLDLYCNCDVKLNTVMFANLLFSDSKLNVQFSQNKNGNYYTITNSVNANFSDSEGCLKIMDKAVKYQSVTIAVSKKDLEIEAVNFDNTINALIINHRKTNSNRKIKQRLTIITDGQLDVNTMAKIEENFKNYKITQ